MYNKAVVLKTCSFNVQNADYYIQENERRKMTQYLLGV